MFPSNALSSEWPHQVCVQGKVWQTQSSVRVLWEVEGPSLECLAEGEISQCSSISASPVSTHIKYSKNYTWHGVKWEFDRSIMQRYYTALHYPTRCISLTKLHTWLPQLPRVQCSMFPCIYLECVCACGGGGGLLMTRCFPSNNPTQLAWFQQSVKITSMVLQSSLDSTGMCLSNTELHIAPSTLYQ